MKNHLGDPLWTFDTDVITVGDNSVGLTASKYNSTLGFAKGAIIKVEGASVRHWTDGNDPSSTEGILDDDGAVVPVEGPNDVRQIRFVRTGGTDAKLHVEYLR